ncbi:hypothetical protein Pst134EA_003338, partial [Puccinia striiformis f. sp. tritici]|uniref:hypothetical protein n=1 Tax=Puccinia striiformis f. sp. tritici TaxID=168172 RepID=UPI002008D6A8
GEGTLRGALSLIPPESVPVAACTSDPPSLYSFQGFEQAPSGLPVSTPLPCQLLPHPQLSS